MADLDSVLLPVFEWDDNIVLDADEEAVEAELESALLPAESWQAGGAPHEVHAVLEEALMASIHGGGQASPLVLSAPTSPAWHTRRGVWPPAPQIRVVTSSRPDMGIVSPTVARSEVAARLASPFGGSPRWARRHSRSDSPDRSSQISDENASTVMTDVSGTSEFASLGVYGEGPVPVSPSRRLAGLSVDPAAGRPSRALRLVSIDSLEEAALQPSEGPASPSASSAQSSSVYALNESGGSHQALGETLGLDFAQLVSVGHERTPLVAPGLNGDEAQRLPRVRFEAPDMQSCSICLEVFKHGMLLTGLECGHVFHVDCLTQWAERSAQCPNCRKTIEPPSGAGIT